MSNDESSGYQPSPNLNDGLTEQQRKDIENNIQTGYNEIPIAIDENGDLVQADKPMPQDEFDQKRREVEEI